MAQLDNATDSDSGEQGFKSLRAGHFLGIPPFFGGIPKKLSAKYPKGFEGDRAERSEVKTSRRDVFRESVADSYSAKHAAVSEKSGFGNRNLLRAGQKRLN